MDSLHEQGINGEDGVLSPVIVATSTDGLLGLYFRDAIEDPNPFKVFLREQTLPFFEHAAQGFARSISEFVRHRNISVVDADQMFDLTPGNHRHNPRNHEYYEFLTVVLSIMPSVAEYKYLPTGFSRRGIIEPPFTAMELLGRIREMQREITKIFIGQTTPRTIIPFNHSLWRTQLFFETARQLPDMYTENPTLVEDKSRQVFEDLLGNTVVDFDVLPTQETDNMSLQ